MAATRLIPLHINKGKTIAQTISERTDYADNPDKTDNGELVTSYECDSRTVDTQFILTKNRYSENSNRDKGRNNIIAYHTRQSFKPGEVDPETANRIGYELALEFTKGKHQFIVATHIDKAHIHNHIVFNSTTIDCTRKFRNFWNSYKVLRKLSDRLCIENGLHIIENPKPSKGHYGTWLGDNKRVSWQDKLKQTIDAVLYEKSADLAAFIQAMREAGYEAKHGKYLAFRAPEQERFTRLRSLKGDYTDEAIMERLAGTRTVFGSDTSVHTSAKPNLLIDIQNSIKAKNSPGYEQWAKVFNLKQAAQTLIYLQENNLMEYEKLEERAADATKTFNDLTDRIKEKEARLNEISSLQKNISSYSRTRDVYAEYRKSGYSKKFLSEHEGDIILHQTAKKAFDALGLQKLPTIKTLQTEYAVVLAEKKKLYQTYRQAKENMKELLTAKNNTDRLLGYSSSGQTHEHDTLRR